MAGFHDGAHGHGDRLPAHVAFALPEFGGLAVQSSDAGGLTAARANRTIRLKPRLDEVQSGNFIVEMVGGENGLGHGRLLWTETYRLSLGQSSITLPT
jgi:hypothetical protein